MSTSVTPRPPALSALPVRALLLVCVLLVARSAAATQHLVSPGQSWADIAAKTRPGDEILLFPGRHKPATLIGLKGTARQPIVIRSADPDNPVTIAADRSGLRLLQPTHVTVENLVIEGATICGLSIENVGQDGGLLGEVEDERWKGHVIVRNVTVRRTGPAGACHAIRCMGIEHIRFERCHVEGWGGSALELYGSSRVHVSECQFIAMEEHSQHSGIRIYGGATDVRIDRCRFECGSQQPGMRVFGLGGDSKPEEFIPPITAESAGSVTRFEASRVRITRNTIIGGEIVVTFDHCTDSMIRNNTMIRPRGCVISVRETPADDAVDPALAKRVGQTVRVTVSYNLIVWEPGDLRRLAVAADHADPEGLTFAPNLWWSTEAPERRQALGTLPGIVNEQKTDLDPALDADLRPQTPQAALFGASAP